MGKRKRRLCYLITVSNFLFSNAQIGAQKDGWMDGWNEWMVDGWIERWMER